MQFKDLVTLIITEMAYGLGDYKPMTLEEFKSYMTTYNQSKQGARNISLTAVFPQTVAKKYNMPYTNLYKVSQTQGMVETDYGAAVNAQRIREGLMPDFVPQPNSKIARWISYPTLAVTTTGLEVMVYRPLQRAPSYWVARLPDNTLKEISKEEAYKYFPPKKEEPPSTTQGVEKKIEYRLYGLNKLIAVSMLHTEILITDTEPEFVEVFALVKGKLRQ